MHRSNSFYPASAARTVVCCVLDSAGWFWGLPLQENRPRTCHPERSEGSQTIMGKAKHLKTQDFSRLTNPHCKSNFKKQELKKNTSKQLRLMTAVEY